MRRSILQPILRRHATWPAMWLLAALSLTLTTSAQSPAPSWWVEREVVNPAQSSDNSAVANIGQLKHLAAMAVEEMNAKLPMRDGAGEELEEWVASWTETGTDDYAAVNVGQLKALAQRFYDRLTSIGLEGNVPWDGAADGWAEFIHIVTDTERMPQPLNMAEAISRAEHWWQAAEVLRVFPEGVTHFSLG